MAFSNEYQLSLLALLCLDKDFFLKVSPVLTKTDFTTFVGQSLYSICTNHFQQYRKQPTKLVIENELLNQEDPLLPEETPLLNKFYSLLDSQTVPEEDYIRTSYQKFVSSHQIRRVLSENTEGIEEGDFDAVIGSLRSAQRQYIFHEDFSANEEGVFTLTNLEELYRQVSGIKSGISLLDNLIGGLIFKELTLIVADSNVGKSTMSVFMGAQAVRQSRRTLHVTLEMSTARTLIKYFSALVDPSDGIGYNNLLRLEPMEKVVQAIIRQQQAYEGYLFLEELPTGRGTIEDIYRFVDKYNPELIIVDYLDLLKPPKSRRDRRFELTDIVIALRGLAVETGCAVLTPTQANRAAHNRRIVGNQHVSEDYEKVRNADTIMSMGQNTKDVIKKEVVVYLSKSRNSEKDKAERYKIDFNTMSFHLIRPEILTATSFSDDEN